MKLGFIGTGNMAGAIMGGIIKIRLYLRMKLSDQIFFAPGREKRKKHSLAST